MRDTSPQPLGATPVKHEGILTRQMLHVTMQVERYPVLEGISHARDYLF